MKPKVTFTHSGNSYALNVPERKTYATGTSAMPYDRTSSSFHSNPSNGPTGINSRLLTGSVNYTNALPANAVSVLRMAPAPVTVNRVQPVGFSTGSKHQSISVAKVVSPAVQEVRRVESYPIALSQVVNVDPAAHRKVDPIVEIKKVESVPLKEQKVAAAAPNPLHLTTLTEASQVQPKFERTKREPNKYVQQAKKKNGGCCGPALWALLGLLGLAALTIALLYGFGVIGGKNTQATPAAPVADKDAKATTTPKESSTSFMFPPSHPSSPTISATTTAGGHSPSASSTSTSTSTSPSTHTTHPGTAAPIANASHPSTTTTTVPHPAAHSVQSPSTVKTVAPQIVAPVVVHPVDKKAVHSKRTFQDKQEVAHIKREEQ